MSKKRKTPPNSRPDSPAEPAILDALEDRPPRLDEERPSPNESGGSDTVPRLKAIDPAILAPASVDPTPHPTNRPTHSTGGEEVSIFDDPKPAPPPSRSAPTPTRNPRVSGSDTAQVQRARKPGESDTLRMKAVQRPTPPKPPVPPSRSRLRQGRVADLPRREFAPRNRFGFLSFIFGFVGLMFKMVFVTVLVMALAAWFSYEAVRIYVKTPEVTVPNVRGMRQADAVKLLSGKKLAIFEERSESSPLVAPGEIIDQRPLPGTSTKEHTIVRVVVSSGRSNFIVPDVVGETRDNAMNKIKGARLEIGDVLTIENEKVPKDTVISQNPEANKGLDQAQKVDLLISGGPRGTSLTMPELTGRSLAEAKATLNALGVTDIVTDPPGGTTGNVASQSPLVGRLILQSQRVTLKLAAAPTP